MAKGIKKIDVICPGFSADCLETLEEMKIQNREIFMQSGGKTYRYIAALNQNVDHIHALSDIIQKHTQGWTETSNSWYQSGIDKCNKAIQQRAKDKGANL